LSAGLNVNVCAFPDGEDPDSYTQNRSYEEVNDFLTQNSQDFIQFKASILIEKSKNDPILKAKTINEIINSISIIPDRIKQEIYIKHCSRIMDVSEEVLFNSLAQRSKNEIPVLSKKRIIKIEKTLKLQKIDILFELERKIIEILLLYGHKEEQFEELILKNDEKGNILLEPTIVNSLVHKKIFLDLQQDEIEFTNDSFKIIYSKIIQEYHENEKLILDVFLNTMDIDLSNQVTSILMSEDQYQLHDWLSKDILVKDKDKVVGQLVTETILSLRTYLINEKVKELQFQTKQNNTDNSEILKEINDYYKLKSLLSNKLNRVI
jgi:DNA primase